MSQTAKAQEPSMEEILASIRRIIADDDSGKAKAAEPEAPAPTLASRPVAAPPPSLASAPFSAPSPRPVPVVANKQEDVDAMLADLDSAPPAAARPAPVPPPKPVEAAAPPPPAPDVLDLTEAMAAQTPSPDFRTIDGASDVVFADRSMEQMPPPPAVETRLPRRNNAGPIRRTPFPITA